MGWKAAMRGGTCFAAQLGPRPPASAPMALALWAAALVNPLPSLGVAHELTQLSAQVLAGWEERKAQMEGMSDAERRSHEDKTCLQRKKLDQ